MGKKSAGRGVLGLLSGEGHTGVHEEEARLPENLEEVTVEARGSWGWGVGEKGAGMFV